MTTPIPTCRGFTNPAIVLVRNSLLQTFVQQSLGYTTTVTTITLWRSRRNLTTGRPLDAAAQPSNKGKSHAVPSPRGGASKPPPPPSQAPPPPPPQAQARAAPPSPKPTTTTRPATKPVTTGTTIPAADPAPVAPPRHHELGSLGYARVLAQKSMPTTLYEAAPQRMFLVSSYTAGLFTVLSGGVNVWFNVYNVPEGTHYLIPWAFGAVGAVMAAFGTRFAMTPSGVIRSISVLPFAKAASPTPASAPTATAAAATKAKAGATTTTTTTSSTTPPPVLLEIRARRITPFPFLPLKRIIVQPHQIIMKARLFNAQHPRKPLPPHIQARQAAEERRRKAAAQQYERDHLMTAPFRHGAWAAGTILASLRRGLTGEGFAPLYVEADGSGGNGGRGARFKLDITGGYALEDGRALDRIVRVEEDARVVAARAAGAGAGAGRS